MCVICNCIKILEVKVVHLLNVYTDKGDSLYLSWLLVFSSSIGTKNESRLVHTFNTHTNRT